MKHFKVFGLALMAMLAFAALASATASAATCPEHGIKCLPLIHILSGETWPLLLEGHVAGKTELQTEASHLNGLGVTILLHQTTLGSLGTFDLHFAKVEDEKEKTKCHTEGDSEAEAVVLTTGSYHLVYTSYSPLEIAALFLVSKFTIKCGPTGNKPKIPIEGQALARVKVPSPKTGTDITELKAESKCSAIKGVPTLKEYFNDNEEAQKPKLTANFGIEPESGCENISEEVTLTPKAGSLATMFTVLW